MVLNQPAIFNIISYVQVFSHLLPLVFFLVFKRNTTEKSLKVIFFYIVYSLINEFLGYYLHEIHFRGTFIFFTFFTVIEFICFSLFYYYAVSFKPAKKIVIILLTLFLTFSLIDFFLVNQMNSFDSIEVGIESIIIILLCILYLIIQLKSTNNLFVYSTSNFWIIITFLTCLSGTFFLYIMAESMISTKAFLVQYGIINSVFNILKNVLLSIAMLMKSTPTQNKKQKNDDWDDFLSHKLNT